jgi:hypothetical protein
LIGSWDTTSVSNTAPSTAAVRDGGVFVIFPHLFDTSRTQYEIAEAVFSNP